ncbi:50S ribosomal protein L24 [Nitrosococcus oceani]|uniref:Large ribosomal subunit protein uL24 n=2 Tax=Nitrosococcus oceani TaxID=1229 RepID=RL24_NITOC|nr:50S ribosomal protein L24 [Nitrosococcus oceani]Q3J8S5.1 RecName: Full=Large ribosomal subunit protein uL24; AltName: Full=50S ribosomal protein L24 [Nitrosococcus oceani ATCC 19707]KFI18849.1 50S ribosomal protein L24 [Nitrosococcus oceani C-27]ABA58771.1 LSU ribosomal protein L24P [Nitrosococcus oceani ATCC 19707]EDZ68506.1 ribosomal protein L24 [Nitrosococcus oceani AFC27]KFI22071.1 50S ribosomal protein L24 [Nitrosococcus oceani]GEM19139.1 50S ribosomal protein L24 [Nitrosococcus ocean
MRRVRVGDEVIVTAGRSKGKQGKILRILGDERVIVQDVNMVKRHTRPNPTANKPGGIIEREASIHISNVMLYNPATEKGDRIGFRRLEDGRKVRYFKSNDEIIDV